MIDTLFNTNKTKAIQTKSKSVLDIFTKTVNDLEVLNNFIDFEAVAKQEEIDRLTSEMNMLNDLKEQHTKVISKINNLFE
jgi:hypothetical protein